MITQLCVGHGYLNILCREEVNNLCYCLKKTNSVLAFASQLKFHLDRKLYLPQNRVFFSLAITLLMSCLVSEIQSLQQSKNCWVFLILRIEDSARQECNCILHHEHVNLYTWPFQTIKICINLVDPIKRELVDYFS